MTVRLLLRGGGSASSVLALALLAGCGADASGAAEPAPRVSAEPTATPVPTPRSASGPLSGRQLPEGGEFGASWKPYVQPGGGESGVVGNGSSTQRREVGEVMEGLTPIGCPEPAVDIALPRPQHALEGSYRGAGDAPGVSLVLQFADPARAGTFLTRLGRQVDACPEQKVADPDIPRLAFDRLPMPGGRVAALRQAYGIDADPARYLLVAVRTGTRVVLVYLAGARPADRTRVAAGLEAAAAR